MTDSVPPKPLTAWLDAQGHGRVVSEQPVGGGCISNGVRLKTDIGSTFFLKTNSQSPADMFLREAEGLAALRVAGGPRLPQVYLVESDFLLLEDLAPASRDKDYWATFGRQMAAVHNHTNKQFGFGHDNYIGSTPQLNTWMDDGYAFFAEQRLRFQAQLAVKGGLLTNAEAQQVELIGARLPDLVPEQPAALMHGDLWSGNAIADEQGQPALIDPAAYYGWPEAELGMTALFGGFGPEFYAAYEEAHPLETGYRERFPIYNLYHLLNHLNLFGRGYHGQVKAILERYA